MTDRSEKRISTMPTSSSSATTDSTRDALGLKFSELHEICACGDSDKLEELLKTGKYEFVNYKDPDWGGRTPLHWCSIKGKGDMVRRLIDKGAHPGLRSTSGWTAAHFAAEAGKMNVLRVLHSLHSPMDRRDLFGDTPRRIAQIYGHKEAMEFLNVAEEEYRDRRKKTELSGEAERHDDEDKEWCQQNSIEPQDYVTPEELLIAESMRSLKSNEDSQKSLKRSKKAAHYGKSRYTSSDTKLGKSPKSARRKSTETTGKGGKSDKKSTVSPKTPRRKEKKKAALQKISEK